MGDFLLQEEIVPVAETVEYQSNLRGMTGHKIRVTKEETCLLCNGSHGRHTDAVLSMVGP